MFVFPFVIGFGLAVVGVSQPTNEEWSYFKAKHGKSYSSVEEENFRKGVFMENMRFISDHNTRYMEGLETYNVAMNDFTDMTNEEFYSLMTGFIPSEDDPNDEEYDAPVFNKVSSVVVPNKMDYRNFGAVTPVRNQGKCGSCYAFGAIAALESHHFLKTGDLVELSEQNAMDCMKPLHESNAGCNGGNHNRVFAYIDENDGIDTRDFYPYEAKDGVCRFDRAHVGAEDYGYVQVAPNEDAMKVAVGEVGPLAVSIHVEGDGFKHYSSGVYNNPNCLRHKGNHAVAVMGYGLARKGGSYWLVKNSWGGKWGEEGYIRMARNRDNQCGIADRAVYPIV